jgi:hypothetical protein
MANKPGTIAKRSCFIITKYGLPLPFTTAEAVDIPANIAKPKISNNNIQLSREIVACGNFIEIFVFRF